MQLGVFITDDQLITASIFVGIVLVCLFFFNYYACIRYINSLFRNKDGMCRNGWHDWKLIDGNRYRRFGGGNYLGTSKCRNCGKKILTEENTTGRSVVTILKAGEFETKIGTDIQTRSKDETSDKELASSLRFFGKAAEASSYSNVNIIEKMDKISRDRENDINSLPKYIEVSIDTVNETFEIIWLSKADVLYADVVNGRFVIRKQQEDTGYWELLWLDAMGVRWRRQLLVSENIDNLKSGALKNYRHRVEKYKLDKIDNVDAEDFMSAPAYMVVPQSVNIKLEDFGKVPLSPLSLTFPNAKLTKFDFNEPQQKFEDYVNKDIDDMNRFAGIVKELSDVNLNEGFDKKKFGISEINKANDSITNDVLGERNHGTETHNTVNDNIINDGFGERNHGNDNTYNDTLGGYNSGSDDINIQSDSNGFSE